MQQGVVCQVPQVVWNRQEFVQASEYARQLHFR